MPLAGGAPWLARCGRWSELAGAAVGVCLPARADERAIVYSRVRRRSDMAEPALRALAPGRAGPGDGHDEPGLDRR